MRLRPLADARSDALALWDSARVRTPFTHPVFVEALGQVFGHRAVALLGDGVGVVGVEKRRGPVRALALTPGATYTSPVLASWPREADTVRQSTGLDTLAVALAASVEQATLALPPSWPDARPFAWNGWALQTRYTALVDLAADPLSRWSHGTRQPAERHAEAFDVREGADQIPLAARFQVDSLARKSVRLGATADTLNTLGRGMHGLGLARAFGAYRDGVCEAAALIAVDGTEATYWIAGSTPGPAMAVLFRHAMPTLHRGGIHTLDLGGANVPGVAQFKRQLGGVLTPVVTARWIGPRWLRALNAIRS
ncbi:MAG: GNAT family N-acetyltransferase [Bacteroidota bacterium]